MVDGGAVCYRVVRAVLPDDLAFDDTHTGSTGAHHVDPFPQKELFHQQGAWHEGSGAVLCVVS